MNADSERRHGSGIWMEEPEGRSADSIYNGERER
jgi:hypothetical protein